MAQFYTLLTQVGQAKLANAVALGNTIELTHLAVGDGGGSLPTPDSDRTALVNEQRRAPINLADIDPDNPNWIVVEQVLPPDVGGWTIREIGVFDSAGDLIAYGNYPETYKPTLDEGSGRTQTVRMVLQVSDTAAVTLRVDPSVVLATRKYVDDGDETVAQGAANALQDHVDADEAHTAQQIAIDPVDQAPDAETVQQALAALGALQTNFATAAEAQALESLTKILTPGRLADAFKGGNQSLGDAGYQILPGGLIIQWLFATNVQTSGGYYTYPISFPTEPLMAVATHAATPIQTKFIVGVDFQTGVNPNSQVRLSASGEGASVSVIAVGY